MKNRWNIGNKWVKNRGASRRLPRRAMQNGGASRSLAGRGGGPGGGRWAGWARRPGRGRPGGPGREGRVGGLGVYGGLGNQAGHTCKEVDSAGLAGTVVGRGQGCARSPRGCERDPTQTI